MTLLWFFSSVNILIPQKVCILTKSFLVFVTYIGSVTCVSRWIHKKARTLVKTILILCIHSGFLSHMNNPVLDKMANAAEALLTFTTLIWFLPSLDSILLTLV